MTADPRNQTEQRQQHTVFVHQLALFYDAMRLSLIAHAVNGTMLLLLLWGAVAETLLVSWYVGVLVLMLYRGYTLYAYRQDADKSSHAGRWYRHAMIGVVLASLVWGGCGLSVVSSG